MIEVKIDSIQVSLTSNDRVIILKDINTEHYLPIWIGSYEADAITIRLQNVQVARPLTHDLLNNVIAEMDGEVSHIVVCDLRNDTFYARITVNLDGRQLKIDSRPSDAIALAVRANVPIFVEENVMAQAGITPETDVGEEVGTEELSAFRDFINTLDLDDLPIH
ncbi:MAG: bifunctional nuclease family protein [Chloroflexota bacterium]|nr:bifunctional nuclease family protein [Chloroflexota bacterium]